MTRLNEKIINDNLSLISRMVEKPCNLNLDFLKSKNWAAVPVPQTRIFTDEEINHLYNAFKYYNYTKGIVVVTEVFQDEKHIANTSKFPMYELPLTIEGLKECTRACSPFNYVLTNFNLDFAILRTSEDYYLYAGDKNFITIALNAPINIARDNFLEFVYDIGYNEKLLNFFLSTHKRYEPFNG